MAQYSDYTNTITPGSLTPEELRPPTETPMQEGSRPQAAPQQAMAPGVPNISEMMNQAMPNPAIQRTKNIMEVIMGANKAYDPTEAIEALKQAKDRSIAGRKESIRSMMDQQALILKNTHAQINLRPLAALVDSQTGSNLASYYKTPTDVATNLAQVQALRKGIAQEKLGLSADEMQAAKLELNAKLEAAKNRNADMFKAYQMKMAQDKANKGNGLKEVPDQIKKTLARTDTALSYIDNILGEVQKNKDVIGPFTGLYSWNPFTGEYMNVTPATKFLKDKGLKRQKFISAIKSYVQAVGLTMEEATLRKDDWEKFLEILGDPSKSDEVITAAAEGVRKSIIMKRNILAGMYQPEIYNVSAIKPNYFDRSKTGKKVAGKDIVGKEWDDMSSEEQDEYLKR